MDVSLKTESTQISIHNAITEVILGCSFDVMNELGSGFLEGIYKKALILALNQKNIFVQEEIPIDIMFRGKHIGFFRADILVEKTIVVELKCCKCLLPEHQAQVINYLKATNLSVGLLINFGQPRLEYKRLYR